MHGSPYPPEPLVHARHGHGRPIHVVLDRRREHHGQPDRVRAPRLDERQRLHDVPLALGERRAPVDDHALVQELVERLDELQVAKVEQDLDDEARVEQVQDRVLDPPAVHVHRQPPPHGLGRPRLLVVLRRGVPQEIPGRIDEGV